MKVINFAKFHGLGNDFILIDNTQSSEPIITPAQAIQLCDRNFGIGGDGVIMALPCQHDCAFTMRIFNSDGSEPQMCGNGIRCLAKFLQVIERMEVQSDVDYEYRIWTKAGVISPRINADGSVTVDMGEPFLTPDLVPTLLAPNKDYLIVKDGGEGVRVSIVVDAKVALEEGYSVQATAVGMGNPHSVQKKHRAPILELLLRGIVQASDHPEYLRALLTCDSNLTHDLCCLVLILHCR